MPDFKIGDVVRLKSGGPLMTVTYVGEEEGELIAVCVWFRNRDSDREQDGFPPESLEKIER